MKELKVQPIKNGTVIDHITPGMAPKVMTILGIPRPGSASTVSVAINVPSGKSELKDIVKVEDRELDEAEVDKIALIAPSATVNTIRNYDVVHKHHVELPEEVVGIVRCPNPSCISNQGEPVTTRFSVRRNGAGAGDEGPGPELTCAYCQREVEHVAEQIV